MGRSQETFNKKDVRNKKAKKRQDKEKKRLAKKENKPEGSSLDDMIAYVDEFGNITDAPPDPAQREVIKAEDIEIGVPKKSSDGPEDTTKIGVVSYFNHSKGYGFIREKISKESIFVHMNDFDGEPAEGMQVSFEQERGPKGPIARNVKKV